MIKAIVFDLNGVFIKGPRLSQVFCDKFGVPIEEFMLALNETMAKIRLPRAGDFFICWQPYFQKWGLNLTKDDFCSLWFGSEKEVPELVELARQLKKGGLKVIIHSNNFAERSAYYQENFPFIKEVFDKVYYSWQTGFIKPDPRGYQKILTDNGLEPQECLYFDDKEENVREAQALGLNSFVFADVDDLKIILGKFGINK